MIIALSMVFLDTILFLGFKMYNWIISNSVIIGLTIDAVALIVSIVLTVVVYKLC